MSTAYLVLGNSSLFDQPTFSLSSLNGTNGFTLVGIPTDSAGWAVKIAYLDNKADLIIGAPGGGEDNEGLVYVVHADPRLFEEPTFFLSQFNETNGDGMILRGVSNGDGTGSCITAASNTIIIGAPAGSAENSGAVYILDGLPSELPVKPSKLPIQVRSKSAQFFKASNNSEKNESLRVKSSCG